MQPRIIAAVSIAPRCCSPPPRRFRRASCRGPANCRPRAARAVRRRSADRPRRRNSRPPPSSPTRRWRSARPRWSTTRASRRSASSSARSPRRRTARRWPDLVAQNFFWMGEKGDKADKKKPGIENLAKAIQLDGKEAPGWEILGTASNDPTGMRFPTARTRSARRPTRPLSRRSLKPLSRRPAPTKATGLIRRRPVSKCTRARSPTRRWSRSSACISSA